MCGCERVREGVSVFVGECARVDANVCVGRVRVDPPQGPRGAFVMTYDHKAWTSTQTRAYHDGI